ncbi:CarD family transcriptional regulator [Aureimonas sp. Leaf454]|uniref:Crp/Fnr family transcriptional regulator n=1 Tax=Aureimonas sp. Leaf454 TaxID=1736381 RepID=UPI0006F71A6D|nr:Crp/Fnr family transcriptional regulator [Aureimonas sp. Leaf454]KQT47596.1 CarD family transcriptional regulator [Aureimonas sp. Leaf454]
MPRPSQADVANRVLSVMRAESFERLRPILEFVDLPTRSVLVGAGAAITHLYFLERGLASVVASNLDSEEIEVGHVGWEGVCGVACLLGVTSTSTRTFMQIAGSGYRVAAAALIDVMGRDADLSLLLQRYIYTMEVQLAHSALANGRYSMQQRLARWLLMCHDRIEGDQLPLTHEFLSLMLGVRRSGVTNEIHVLEGYGLLKATRGLIRIVDRCGLEALAGGCYGIPEREYERLLGIGLKVA